MGAGQIFLVSLGRNKMNRVKLLFSEEWQLHHFLHSPLESNPPTTTSSQLLSSADQQAGGERELEMADASAAIQETRQQTVFCENERKKKTSKGCIGNKA